MTALHAYHRRELCGTRLLPVALLVSGICNALVFPSWNVVAANSDPGTCTLALHECLKHGDSSYPKGVCCVPYLKASPTTPRNSRRSAALYMARVTRGGQQYQQEHDNRSDPSTVQSGRSFANTQLMSSKSAFETDEGQQKTPTSAWTVSAYHLVWSPGFRKHFKIALICLGLWQFLLLPRLHVATSLHELSMRMTQHPLVPNVLLPLLSSSCCLIQVLINVLIGTAGCAGFNTYLGPIRPYFLTLLGYMTFTQTAARTATSSIIRLLIAFMPELLHVWNTWLRGNIIRQNRSQAKSLDDAPLVTLDFEIPTMGCVACINKIDSSIRQTASNTKYAIESSRAWLESNDKKGGRAQVQLAGVQSQSELDSISRSIVRSIEDAGFGGCRVISSGEETCEATR